MSAEILRRAAALIRERAEAVPHASPWKPIGAGTVAYPMTKRMGGTVAKTYPTGGSPAQWATTEHIASWHPDVALAVADLLDRAAEHHRSESVDDLYLWDCDECPEGDCAGHTRDCCWGCVAQGEDGYAGRVFYPCGEMTAALSVARAYLGESA